ncbi:MAG: hypothetical protein J6W31_03520, partial [Clostridia bacterium]|nr:hypothetical protein [Clostridia bacterium]
MKRKSLLALLLVAALTVACVIGLMLGATAEGANKIVFAVGDLTVEELGVEGATYTTDIMGALSALDAASREHPSDTVAEIHIKGDLTGGDQGNLLFAQKTIWREDGTKLPISIIGHDTAEPRDAYIYLDGIGGWYTCANDYTFENLTLPVGDQETYFYAGSGNVRLDNVKLLSSGEMTVASVADRTAFYLNSKEAALSVCADLANLITPDVKRLPAGDAWQKVRESEEYMATGTVLTDKDGVPYVDKDLTGANGSLYGDYGHAGNTGGGQYLNACVYYEAILGLDCRENDWTPTKYALDKDLQKILQEAAHAAVLEVYGEDHFKNPVEYERQGDGVVNLLMMGSSSSYYMRDELHFMAEHIGIKFRVVHAYSSGIKMSTQWSWTEDQNGKWSVYTEWNGETSEKKEQKMTDFVALHPWDAIVTYTTGGEFNKKNLKVEGYNEASVAKAIATTAKADEFINYVYDYNENNGNARYFWFQTVSAPVGAPGPSDSAEGFIFADNNTSAAYAGWTEADLERYSEDGKVVSSLTLGESITFGSRANAVGYMLTAPETPFTDETAAQVEFIHLNGFESDVDVRPVNTLGKLILDADTAAISSSPIKRGYSPASAELHIKKGSAKSIVAYGSSASGLTKYGDITFRWTGGNIEEIDLISSCNITGDLNVILDLPQGSNTTVTMIRVAFGTNIITGDVNVSAKNLTVSGSVYSGGGAKGTVNNTFENCTVVEDFFAVRSSDCGKVVNNVKNCTVGGKFHGGHWDGRRTAGPIINNIDGLQVTGAYYGGTNSGGGSSGLVAEGSVEVNGKNETLAIYNNVSNSTFAGAFVGGSSATAGGAIRNDIRSSTVSGNYYGGSDGGSVKHITNNIYGGTFSGNFHGGTYSGTPTGITNTVYGGTFVGTYGGANYSGTVNGTVTNNIYGGSFTVLSGGFIGEKDGTVTVKGDILNTIKGAVTISKSFAGGTAESTAKRISIVDGTIVNTIDKNEKGEAPSIGSPASDSTSMGYYGAGHHTLTRQGTVNYVKAGTFKKIWFGGGQYLGYVQADTGFVADAHTPAGVEKGKYSVINLIQGGNFAHTQDNRNYVWGGPIGFNSNYKHGAILGGVYTEVSGDPVFDMRLVGGFRGFAAGESNPVTVKISGGTFNNYVFMLSSQLGTGLPGTIHTGNSTITGGTFNKAVYGGSNGAGSATNCTLTVQGGTFNDALIASSVPKSGTTISGSFTLTLEPTAGDIVLKKAVSAQNDAETVAIKGGDKKLILASDAKITASSYDGKALNLHRAEGWTKGTTYLTLPTAETNANITATKGESAKGGLKMVVNGTETRWIGMDSTGVYGVNLILEQKIGLRLWLNKAEVDAIGEDFTYEITSEGKTLAAGTYAELMAKAEVKKQGETEYYTLVLGGLEPAAFHKAILLGGEGLDPASYSINDILGIV